MHRAESTATSRQQADSLAGTERAMWLHCEGAAGHQQAGSRCQACNSPAVGQVLHGTAADGLFACKLVSGLQQACTSHLACRRAEAGKHLQRHREAQAASGERQLMPDMAGSVDVRDARFAFKFTAWRDFEHDAHRVTMVCSATPHRSSAQKLGRTERPQLDEEQTAIAMAVRV